MEKPVKGAIKFDTSLLDENTDEYDIDANLKKELEENNLAYKYIDFKQAKLNGGRSRGGWVIYRRTSGDPRTKGIPSLIDPDGLVRHGSMVLAVKTKEGAARQKARVSAQNKTLRQYNKNVAAELEGDARKAGNSKILAGYEKNT